MKAKEGKDSYCVVRSSCTVPNIPYRIHHVMYQDMGLCVAAIVCTVHDLAALNTLRL